MSESKRECQTVFRLRLQYERRANEVSLPPGAASDLYVIKEDKTGKETVVMGDAKLLAVHANNHQVTLTGTMAKEKDKDVLKASGLKMITVCK